jgi:SecD/SecF fusion protein
VTPHDAVIAAISEANPVDPTAQPGPRERAEADAIRRRVLSSPARSRPRAAPLVPVLGTVVVLLITAVFLGVGTKHRPPSAAPRTTRTLILQALPGPTPVITPTVMARELQIVRERLSTVSGSLHATLAGTNRIRVVAGRDLSPAERERIVALLAPSAQLYFYDWEANVLAPNGRTVASQLLTQNASAARISQGGGYEAPGDPGSGSMPLYQAVKLASKQPTTPFSPSLSRVGPEYYLFGKPGSAACATAAADGHTPLIKGRYCLLSGPNEETSGRARAQAITDLDAGLPAGVTPAQAAAQSLVLVVPQGTVVIQAANPSPSQQTAFSSATAQFYVLKDRVALTGEGITHPTRSIDSSGDPDVNFRFTPNSAAQFQRLTAQLARRGVTIHPPGQTENQHFAVVLSGPEDQLITVPSIDFRQYPDGINASGGADITGGMTATSAKDLATQLRYGALPLNLRALR